MTAGGSSNQLRHRSKIPGSGGTCKPCIEFRVAASWVITCVEVSFLVMPLLLSHPWSCKQPWTHTPDSNPSKNSLAQPVGLPCNQYISLSLILFLELINICMCTVSPQKKSLTQMKSITLRRNPSFFYNGLSIRFVKLWNTRQCSDLSFLASHKTRGNALPCGYTTMSPPNLSAWGTTVTRQREAGLWEVNIEGLDWRGVE